MPADMTLEAPVEYLLDSASDPGVLACAPRSNPRGRPRHRIDIEALQLYGGFDKLLVRTAIVRAPGYEQAQRQGPLVASSKDVIPLLEHLRCADNEYVVVLSLNATNRVDSIYEASIGGVTSAAVEVQQVIKVPLLTSAARFIVVHNHPSGSSSPSADDQDMTQRLKQAAACVDLQFLDHLIIARTSSFSFLDAGMM